MNRVIWSEAKVHMFRQLSRSFSGKHLTRESVTHSYNHRATVRLALTLTILKQLFDKQGSTQIGG